MNEEIPIIGERQRQPRKRGPLVFAGIVIAFAVIGIVGTIAAITLFIAGIL